MSTAISSLKMFNYTHHHALRNATSKMMSQRFLRLVSPPIAQLVERRTVDDTLAVTGILRSLVQIRLGGHFFKILFCDIYKAFDSPWEYSFWILSSYADTETTQTENLCQKWDSNPRPHSWTRMLLLSKEETDS